MEKGLIMAGDAQLGIARLVTVRMGTHRWETAVMGFGNNDGGDLVNYIRRK